MPCGEATFSAKETTADHIPGECAAGCAAAHEAACDQLADALVEVIMCVTGDDGGSLDLGGQIRAEIRALPLEAVAANLRSDARRIAGFDDVAAMLDRFETAGSPVG